ncbi:hypothetical protein BUALT_Bualt02G0075200 [Buddleja alternifolia]|uniref:Transposase MuDR plant domain-containing protein n=1 Tax=Buddleja alternifolia TaxID=168488 RepID=A0AAV6Y4L8_9LAMI|nr:hypothetical protein BUALT_Bualt02G0075200 [Buddleja alternifolia]
MATKIMKQSTIVSFDVWLGGVIEWLPTVRYFGGRRVKVPNVDLDKFFKSDIWDMYEKAGGKSAIIDMYYRLPGFSMDKGLRQLEGDSDCLEIYRQYKGKSVVPIYIEDVGGPLAALDAENNPINLEQPIPAICYPSDYNEMVNVLDEAESNFGDLAQGVNDLGTEINASDLDEDVNTGVKDENEINIGDLGKGGSAESVTGNNNGETENNFGQGLNDDGENENNVGGFSEEVHEENLVNEEHDNTVHEYVLKGWDNGINVGVDDQVNGETSVGRSDPTYEPQSDTSEDSDCPSWMLEDLEGPSDDDIFVSKPPDHEKKLLKRLRAFMKQRKQKIVEQKRNEEIEKNREQAEWYTDAEDEDELHSLPGSDEEGLGYKEWYEGMDVKLFDKHLLGMKFPTKAVYRDQLRDWAVKKGWDLKVIKNERKFVTAICKKGCEWRVHASLVQNSTTFQVKSLKGEHTCAHITENKQANYKYIGRRIEHIIRDNLNETLDSLQKKIKRDLEIGCSMHKIYRAKRYALELVKGDTK